MAARGFIELLRLADLAQARQSGRRSRDNAQWVGVAFELGGERFVAPMGEVSEVLAMPSAVTPVPLSKPWLIGVANVRGRLLPLTDLTTFLSLSAPAVRINQRKVMVIDQPELLSGFLVDRVMGIQQFDRDDYVAESLTDDSPFLPYNHGRFEKDGQSWLVFMPSLLTEDNRYLEAAI